jgi:3',5'-cyclic-AMP phosphodiesterase
MPGVFYQPNRREFLRGSLLAGVAVVLQGCQSSPKGSLSLPDEEVRLALISDTHVGLVELPKERRPFDPRGQLRQIVPDIISGRPRGVILNGDAAFREGLNEDYVELKTLLNPLSAAAPVYIGLGNHDDRANFKKIFTAGGGLDAGVANHHVLIIEEPWIRFIVLDSLLYVNRAAGLLGEKQRAWLGEYLNTHRDKPAILFVHHTLGEGDGDLLDAGRMFEIIRPNRQVKAIFYGHSHAWNISERQGVKLINLPAVGYNFTAKEPVGWVDARFGRKGVELTLHAIAGNREQDGKSTWVGWS